LLKSLWNEFYSLVNPIPSPPSNLWNHRVGEKSSAKSWAERTYSQNLENK
jgi:hypothetical protein